MSEPINNGGPAFPVDSETWDRSDGMDGMNGMTLRDYFAAKAMQGVLAGEANPIESVAQFAYRMADAMLKARTA